MKLSILLVLVGLLSVAAAKSEPLVPRQFEDGDVVCFIGDSITHSRKYHSYIYDYYLTRFPDRKIRFVNCGISGDSAGGALQRMDWDILPHEPNVASIMLGMNDVGRGLYGKDNPDEDNLKRRAAALSGHKSNMDKIAQTLREKRDPYFIFLTPSPYDQTVKVETESLFGVNEALAECGQYGAELAARYAGGVVDFHGPMTAMNLEGQKTDPAFTLIGPDRVHPGDVGQLVMAYLYLKAQQVPAQVSEFVILPKAGCVETAENGEITDLVVEENRIEFNCLENALPYPVENGARAALDLVPIVKELNQQMLVVRLDGNDVWRLSIDGEQIADYEGNALAAGINLAMNEKTPQYKQAQEVLSVNETRRSLEVQLRSYAQIKIMLMRAKVPLDDDAAVQAYFDNFLATQGNTAYFGYQFKTYQNTKPVIDDIWAKIDQLTQKLWEINQPKAHKYTLERVNR